MTGREEEEGGKGPGRNSQARVRSMERNQKGDSITEEGSFPRPPNLRPGLYESRAAFVFFFPILRVGLR